MAKCLMMSAFEGGTDWLFLQLIGLAIMKGLDGD
jgi:hypothetical protein